MANNPYVNKVQLADGTSLIDLSSDTAVASDVAQGKYFHLATGERVQGTASGGGTTWETEKDGSYTIYSSSPNYMLIANYTTAFASGETYRVTWGSDTFVCETHSDGGQSYDGYYIGNPGVVGGTDDGSGATFFIYRDRSDRAVAATSDAAGTKYLKIEKQISSGGGNYQTKTNITPTTISQTITADTGYDALESVQINAIPSQYIIPTGNKAITANGSNIDVAAFATVSVAVSGGASNVATGTFKGTTTGAALNVTLSYSGSGYPVAFAIYPDEDFIAGNTFYDLIQNYATCMMMCVKWQLGTAPDYSSSGDNNKGMYFHRYKNSKTSATTYGQSGGNNTRMFGSSDASGSFSSTACIAKLKSNTSMSVYIAGTTYGFAANIKYRYWVLYSS